MSLITIWQAGIRMRMRALAVLALWGMTFHQASARTAHLITLEDGRRQSPVVHESKPMPIGSSSTEGLLAVEPRVSDLGAFSLVINAGPALAGNAAALAAFNRAAQQWDGFIADPITVTIDADLAPLGAGILGSASSVTLAGSYATIRDAMVLDAQTETDDAIVTLLPTSATASFILPVGFDLDGNVQLTKANAKALGFPNLDAQFGASDGEITFSSQFAFDFDNSNGVTPGWFDFETVAAHEIGHALGFISDVDYVDAVLNLNLTAPDVRPTALDLFRFADNVAGSDPATPADFTAFPRSLVPGAIEMMDQIDGSFGGDAEILFSTGDTQGDGQQASHWKDLSGLGIMDPTLAPGVALPIIANDLRALDLIGYEITLGVPEPSAAAMAALVTIIVAAKARKVRRQRPGV